MEFDGMNGMRARGRGEGTGKCAITCHPPDTSFSGQNAPKRLAAGCHLRSLGELTPSPPGYGSGTILSHTCRCHGPYAVGWELLEEGIGGGREVARVNEKKSGMEGGGKIE